MITKKIRGWQIIALLIIIGGVLLSGWAAHQQDTSKRSELLLNTRLAQTGITSANMGALTGSAADLTSPEYIALKIHLEQIRANVPAVRFAYLMGQRQDGTIFFYADSEPSTSKDYSPPGQVYTEASDGARSVFLTGSMVSEGPVSDRWGTWVTGFTPVMDPGTGKVIAVMGMDVDAKDWNLEILRQSLPTLIVTFLILLMVLAFTLFQQRAQEDERRIAAAQEIVQEKEAFQRVLLDNLTASVVIVDAETHVITYANPMALSLIGAAGDEVLGKICHTFICPAEKGKCPITDLNVAVENSERILLNVRGKRIPIIKSVKSITIGGKKLLIETFVDISELKEMEEHNAQLIRELEAANNELKDFAYIVSHDLKAPLRAIGSLSNWIYADYKDKFDKEGKVQLDLLVNRVNRMQSLIEGILEYSRVGRISEKKETLDSNMILREVIDNLSPPSNISIIIDTSLPAVQYEKTRIRQVFANLIGNAIKYMDKPEGEIHVGCTQDGNYWKFSVKDNGPGIDEKYYDRVFQIFQTLHARDEIESTGIGLTIVKKIIEMYGGSIWIESELGRGSIFYFTIPIQVTEPVGGVKL